MEKNTIRKGGDPHETKRKLRIIIISGRGIERGGGRRWRNRERERKEGRQKGLIDWVYDASVEYDVGLGEDEGVERKAGRNLQEEKNKSYK